MNENVLNDIQNEANDNPDRAFDDLVEAEPDAKFGAYPLGDSKTVESAGVLLDPKSDARDITSRMRAQCRKIYQNDNNVLVDWDAHTVRPLSKRDISMLIRGFKDTNRTNRTFGKRD